MNRLYVGTLFQAVPECFFKILGEITCKELFRLSVHDRADVVLMVLDIAVPILLMIALLFFKEKISPRLWIAIEKESEASL